MEIDDTNQHLMKLNRLILYSEYCVTRNRIIDNCINIMKISNIELSQEECVELITQTLIMPSELERLKQ